MSIRWQNGPGKDAKFFPIAVWLQDPRNAPKYQALGINLYVALWKGPTAGQIAELKRHHMPVICEQNEYALKHLDEKTIVGLDARRRAGQRPVAGPRQGLRPAHRAGKDPRRITARSAATIPRGR